MINDSKKYALHAKFFNHPVLDIFGFRSLKIPCKTLIAFADVGNSANNNPFVCNPGNNLHFLNASYGRNIRISLNISMRNILNCTWSIFISRTNKSIVYPCQWVNKK